jgi:hypothetical protein
MLPKCEPYYSGVAKPPVICIEKSLKQKEQLSLYIDSKKSK